MVARMLPWDGCATVKKMLERLILPIVTLWGFPAKSGLSKALIKTKSW